MMIWSFFWLASLSGSSFLSTRAADINQIRDKLCNDHNMYRKRHHVPALKLKEQLNINAQNWSENLLSTRILQHQPHSKFGENLWSGSGFKIDDVFTNEKANPVTSWYSEIEYYPTAPSKKWGHFTQLIWKESKFLGCGISSDDEVIFVVCNYDPPGNRQNHYHENVFTVEGLPYNDSVKEIENDGSGSGGGDDDTVSGSDEPFDLSDERDEPSTSYWMYGFGFAIILLVVVFLAILIYYQNS